MRVDKVIVTNLTALRGKHGVAGTKAIQAAANTLIAEDRKHDRVVRDVQKVAG